MIGQYDLVPARYTPALANALPGLEIALGLALAAGILPAIAGWCASAALLVFAAAVAINLRRGRRFDCGCGALRQRPISWFLVSRNVILAVIAAIVAVRPAGLALWTPGLMSGNVSASAQNLIPVPLVVIAAAAASQCARAYRVAMRVTATARPAAP